MRRLICSLLNRFWGDRSVLAYAWRTQIEVRRTSRFWIRRARRNLQSIFRIARRITQRRHRDGSPSAEGWCPEQKLTLAEALSAYTVGAAYAANAENRLGKLAENYHADLIVLEQDIFTVHPDELLTMHAAATMVNGEWVYTSS